MEGRWEVRTEDGFGNYTKGPSTVGWVPAVPCDDAAIERAGKVLSRMIGWTPTYAQHIARTVLRAAGETP